MVSNWFFNENRLKSTDTYNPDRPWIEIFLHIELVSVVLSTELVLVHALGHGLGGCTWYTIFGRWKNWDQFKGDPAQTNRFPIRIRWVNKPKQDFAFFAKPTGTQIVQTILFVQNGFIESGPLLVQLICFRSEEIRGIKADAKRRFSNKTNALDSLVNDTNLFFPFCPAIDLRNLKRFAVSSSDLKRPNDSQWQLLHWNRACWELAEMTGAQNRSEH